MPFGWLPSSRLAAATILTYGAPLINRYLLEGRHAVTRKCYHTGPL